MSALDLSGVAWRKSTRSGGGNDCVEVAFADLAVAVRDSKDRRGPVLVFRPDAWRAFVAAVRHGDLSAPDHAG